MGTRKSIDGPERLRQHIKQRFDGNISAFCRETGLDRIQIQRIVKRERGGRMTVDFATKIERATAGDVKVSHWASGDAPRAA